MKVLGIIVALVLGVYVYSIVAYPSVTIRYRLTLVVEADGKQHVGSGVLEVRYVRRAGWMTNRGVDVGLSVRGEAVAVDIPDRGTLFALLKENREMGFVGFHSRPPEMLLLAFNLLPLDMSDRAQVSRLKNLSGERSLEFSALPMLVRFRNIDAPMSVEQVDPRNLVASFGPNIYMTRASIEITAEPVTTGIEKRLLWLAALKGQYLGKSSSVTPLGLHGGDFSRKDHL